MVDTMDLWSFRTERRGRFHLEPKKPWSFGEETQVLCLSGRGGWFPSLWRQGRGWSGPGLARGGPRQTGGEWGGSPGHSADHTAGYSWTQPQRFWPEPPRVLGSEVRPAWSSASSLDSAEDRYPSYRVRWPHLLPKPGLDDTRLCFHLSWTLGSFQHMDLPLSCWSPFQERRDSRIPDLSSSRTSLSLLILTW